MNAIRAVQSALGALPMPPLWPTGVLIGLVFSPIYVPIIASAIVLSSPLYATAVDVLTQTTMSGVFVTSPMASSLTAITVGPAIVRLIVVTLLQRHYPHTTRARRYFASVLCSAAIAFHVFAYRAAPANTIRSTALLVALIGDVLVLTSEWWIPSSLEALDEAENALIAEMRIDDVTERGVVEGISYVRVKSRKQTADSVNLVMLHGYGAGKLFWFGQLTSAALTDSYNVYSVDLAGFGMSDPTPLTEWTAEAGQRYFVASLERWRRAMRIDNMVLLGHSYGGYIAACYGLVYPQYVDLLILVSPVGVPEPPPMSSPEYFRRVSRIPVVWRKLISAMWNWRITPASALAFAGPLGPFFVKTIVSFRFSKYVTNIRPSLISDYLYQINSGAGVGLGTLSALIMPGAWARRPISQLIKDELTIPVDFIYGENDWMQPEEGQKLSVALNQRGLASSFHRVSNSGHQLVVENAAEFNRIVVSLIQRVTPQKHAKLADNKRSNNHSGAHGDESSDESQNETSRFVHT